MSFFYWLALALTAVSALISLGFSLAALRQRNIYAEHAASRSVALVVAVVVAFFLASQPLVFVLTLLMTVVLALDAVVGARQRDVMKTVGPAVLAVFKLVVRHCLRDEKAVHAASDICGGVSRRKIVAGQ